MLDLNHKSSGVYGRAITDPQPLGVQINARIDAALVAERTNQRPRDYLGASRIGEPCAQRLVYEFTKTTVDPGKDFEGRTLRIFEAATISIALVIFRVFSTLLIWVRISLPTAIHYPYFSKSLML